MSEKILVVKYKCKCGRKYSTKRIADHHEEVCKCWTNPDLKTCKTCVFGKLQSDSNGMEHEPHNLHTWKQWVCSNPKFHDGYFKSAHENAPDLNINCFLHTLKP